MDSGFFCYWTFVVDAVKKALITVKGGRFLLWHGIGNNDAQEGSVSQHRYQANLRLTIQDKR